MNLLNLLNMNKLILSSILALSLYSSTSAQFSLQQDLGYALEELEGFQTADLNGDGLSDIVAYTNDNNSKLVGQLQLDEPGTFSLPFLITDDFQFAKGIELADLDADGDLDIMLLADSPLELIWFENQRGAGQFGSGKSFPLSADIFEHWTVEDFNLDGAADLIYHSFFDGGSTFFVSNDGQGNFAAPVQIAANEQRARNQFYDTYDWNKDDFPDLIIAGSEDMNDLKLLLFDPQTKSFLPPQVILSGVAEPRYLRVDDLDDNGQPDLVLYHRLDRNNFQLVRFFRESEEQVWQQDTIELTQGGFSINYLNIQDLDQNGEKDIIIGTFDFSFNGGLFCVKQENGQFLELDTLQQDLAKSRLYALEDFNGDGKTDLLLGNDTRIEYALFSDKEQGWPNIQPIPINMWRWRMKVGDMDSDGDNDILVTSPLQGCIAVIENQQSFGRIKILESGLSQASRAFPMDIDQDGDQDFLYVKYSGFSDGGFWLYRNNGNGEYASELVDRELLGGDNVWAVDLDSDGDLDLVTAVALWKGIFYYLNEDGEGQFGDRQVLSLPEAPTDVEMVDWDKDGDEDLIMALSSDQRLQLSRWEDGKFQEPEVLRVVQGFWPWKNLAVLDVNQDDYPDVISYDGSGSILYHLNTEKDSSDFYEWAFLYPKRKIEVNHVIGVDINNDGQKDVLASTELNRLQDSLLWIPAPFDSTIQEKAVYQNPPAGFIHQVYQLDGDARPDLIIYNEEKENFSWWKNETGAPTLVTKTFYDPNANGKLDPGEPLLQDIPVIIDPAEQVRFSNKDGSTVFFLTDGEYSADVQFPDIWRPTTPSSQSFVAGPASEPDTLLFGLEAINPIAEGKITAVPSRLRCNLAGYVDIQLKNTGTLPISGEVRLLTEAPLKINFAEGGEPITDKQTATWLVEDLPITQSLTYRAHLDPVSTEFIGDTLQARVLASMLGPEGQMVEDTFQIFTPLFCSYDPNDKLVQTARSKAKLIDPGEELFYTIRFQNTGNDTAFQVVLRDPLTPKLDWLSLQPLNASHEYDVQLDQDGLLTIRFSNIKLVDSLTNPIASQGFFQFSIKSSETLQIGDLVQNQAAIYFDGNPPIFTNTVISQIRGAVNTGEEMTLHNKGLKVFPNPANRLINLEWESGSAVRIDLLDVYGRVLQTGLPGREQRSFQWNIGKIPRGLYLVRVTMAEEKIPRVSWIAVN